MCSSDLTEIADALLQRADVPFRIGHHFASLLTDFGRGKGLTLQQIAYADANRIYEKENKQPLPLDPDTYWKGAVRLPEEVMGDVTPPPTSCALPRRLGPFPFWQGQKPLLDALEPIYKKASQHAVVFLLGESAS